MQYNHAITIQNLIIRFYNYNRKEIKKNDLLRNHVPNTSIHSLKKIKINNSDSLANQ